MKELRLLKQKLTPLLPIHQARVTFIAQFILALLDAQTTNFTKLSEKFKGKVQVESHYRRIQRFFTLFKLDLSLIARLIVALVPFGDKWVLCLDRTNWKFGKVHINFLVLGIAYKGVCIPLFWCCVRKAGNSNTQERIELIQRFVRTFGVDKIAFLTADREFVGREWILSLRVLKIPFRIRVRKNAQVLSARSHQKMALYKLFRGCRLQQTMVLKKKRVLWGVELYVIGLRTADDYVLLITDHAPHEAMEDYKRRWEIETLFGCLKSRGFDFEETHLNEPERMDKLLALLTLALCWCFLYGEVLVSEKKIAIKKHGRPAKSIFRRGLEELSNILANIPCKLRAFKKALSLLSCT